MPDAEPQSGPSGDQLDRILLQALLRHLPDAVYFKDRTSRFLRVNAAMAKAAGAASPEALIGRSDFDLFTAEHARPAFADEQRIIATGEPLRDLVERETWPDGHTTWVSTTKVPLRDLDGAIIGTFGVSRDITERQQIEEQNRALAAQLELAQKLESVGRLSAGIAHEINTPGQFVADNLRFLSLSLQQLERYFNAVQELQKLAAALPQLQPALAELAAINADIELDFLRDELPRCIAQSLDGMARIARIVGALKDFAHPHAQGRTPADLGALIETALAVSRHEWKYVAEAVTELDPELPPVPVVIDELNQALLNLIVNAAHAVALAVKQRGREKGRIVIRTRANNTHAVIEVEDDGPGIPPDVRPRLFEPFVTTKRADKAPGQGLYVVHSIVRHHGGRIDYETSPDRGTIFRIHLPLDPPGGPSTTTPDPVSS